MTNHYYFVQETSGEDAKTLVSTMIFASLDAAITYGRSLLNYRKECHQVHIIDSENLDESCYVLAAE